MFGQVNWTGRDRCLGSHPAWYLTHEYADRDQTCDLQKLQVAPLTVPLFPEGRCPLSSSAYSGIASDRTGQVCISLAPLAYQRLNLPAGE
jgi:hypothetical protein